MLVLPGQYADQESGLFYNVNRYYDPSRGAFPQAVPIGLYGGSYSPYVAVSTAPTMFTDPDGLLPGTAMMPDVGGGGGGSCDSEACGKLRANICRKFNLLLAELNKYDATADAKGGFLTVGG